MARTSWDKYVDRGESSAQSLRNDMQERLRMNRIAQDSQYAKEMRHANGQILPQSIENAKRSVEKVTRPATSLVREAVMHQINSSTHDPTSQEIRKAWHDTQTTYSVVKGAAMLVAAVAFEAVGIARSERAIEDFHYQAKHDREDYTKEISKMKEMSLRDYDKAVVEDSKHYNTKIATENEILQHTLSTSIQERAEEKDRHTEKIDKIKEERTLENKKYEGELSAAKDEHTRTHTIIENERIASTQKRDEALENSKRTYENNIKSIENSSLTREQKQERIQSENLSREARESKIQANYSTEIRKLDSRVESNNTILKNKETQIASTHEHNVKLIDNNEKGEARRHDREIKRIDDGIVDARNTHKVNIEKINKDYSNRQSVITSARSSAAQPAAWKGVHEMARSYKSEGVKDSFGKFAYMIGGKPLQIKTSIQNSNLELSKDLVFALGTKEEKELLRRHLTNDPTLSAEEKTKVNKMLTLNGASNLNSDKEISQTLQIHSLKIQEVASEISKVNSAISANNKELDRSNNELNALHIEKDKLDQVRQTLAKGVDAEGKPLTKTQKAAMQKDIKRKDKELSEKISNAGGKVAELTQKSKELQSSLINLIGLKKGLQSETKYIKKHKNFLLNKGVVKGLGKTAITAHLLKGGSKRITSSIKTLQKKIEKQALKGNVVNQEMHKLATTGRRVNQGLTFVENSALSIGRLSAKMVRGTFNLTIKNLFTREFKALKVLNGSKILNNGFVNFFKNAPGKIAANKAVSKLTGAHKFLTKGTNIAGIKIKPLFRGGFISSSANRLMKMQSFILNMPANIQNLPSTLVKTGVTVAGRTAYYGGALALRGGIKISMRAGRMATPYAKMGINAVGKGVRNGASWVGRKIAGSKAGRAASSLLDKMKRFYKKQILNRVKSVGAPIVAFLGPKFRFVGNILGAVGHFVGNMFKGIGKFFEAIFGAISAVIGFMVSLILESLLVVVCLAIFVFILILALILLLSVYDAINAYFRQFKANEDTHIINNPTFPMQLASNYRNEELRILEYFDPALHDPMQNTSYEKRWITEDENGLYSNEVSSDPLYYAVYDSSFHWPWTDVGKHDAIGTSSKNLSAETVLEGIENIKNRSDYVNGTMKQKRTFWQTIKYWWNKLFNDKDNDGEVDTNCPSNVANYSNISVRYIDAKNVKFTKTDNTYNVDEASVISQYNNLTSDNAGINYEYSNAKDVLAIADAIYQVKGDDFRVTELFAYLGVGPYQVVNNNQTERNLFWDSHKIVYPSGTKSTDIYYHTTSQNPTITRAQANDDGTEYNETATYFLKKSMESYNSNGGRIPHDNDSNFRNTEDCKNHEKREITYDTQVEESVWARKTTHTQTADWLEEPIIRDDFTINLNSITTPDNNGTVNDFANSKEFKNSINSSAFGNNKLSTINTTYSSSTYYKFGESSIALPDFTADQLFCVSSNSQNGNYYILDKNGALLSRHPVNLNALKDNLQASNGATTDKTGITADIWNILINQDIPQEAAAGILGNMKVESLWLGEDAWGAFNLLDGMQAVSGSNTTSFDCYSVTNSSNYTVKNGKVYYEGCVTGTASTEGITLPAYGLIQKQIAKLKITQTMSISANVSIEIPSLKQYANDFSTIKQSLPSMGSPLYNYLMNQQSKARTRVNQALTNNSTTIKDKIISEKGNSIVNEAKGKLMKWERSNFEQDINLTSSELMEYETGSVVCTKAQVGKEKPAINVILDEIYYNGSKRTYDRLTESHESQIKLIMEYSQGRFNGAAKNNYYDDFEIGYVDQWVDTDKELKANREPGLQFTCPQDKETYNWNQFLQMDVDQAAYAYMTVAETCNAASMTSRIKGAREIYEEFATTTIDLDHLPNEFVLTKQADGQYSMTVYTNTDNKARAADGVKAKRKYDKLTLSPSFEFNCEEGQEGHGEYVTTLVTTHHTDTVNICLGHMDLDAAVVVVLNESDVDAPVSNNVPSLLDIAQQLPKQAHQEKGALYTYNKDLQISGWGGIEIPAYDPEEDCAPGGEIRSLAILKTQGDLKYDCPEDIDWDVVANGEDGNNKTIKLDTKQVKDIGFGKQPLYCSSIYKTPDNYIAWIAIFKNKMLFMNSLKSGQQRFVPAYEGQYVYNFIVDDSMLQYNGVADYKEVGNFAITPGEKSFSFQTSGPDGKSFVNLVEESE